MGNTLSINYTANGSRGCMNIDLDLFVLDFSGLLETEPEEIAPADIRIVTKSRIAKFCKLYIDIADDYNTATKTLYSFLSGAIDKLTAARDGRLYINQVKAKQEKRLFTERIEKLVTITNFVAERYGFNSVSDNAAAELIKVKKADILTMRKSDETSENAVKTDRGFFVVEEISGYRFTKYGYVFDVYKKYKNTHCILLSGTGSQVATCSNCKEAPDFITEEMIETIKKNPDMLRQFVDCFRKVTAETFCIIPKTKDFYLRIAETLITSDDTISNQEESTGNTENPEAADSISNPADVSSNPDDTGKTAAGISKTRIPSNMRRAVFFYNTLKSAINSDPRAYIGYHEKHSGSPFMVKYKRYCTIKTRLQSRNYSSIMLSGAAGKALYISTGGSPLILDARKGKNINILPNPPPCVHTDTYIRNT